MSLGMKLKKEHRALKFTQKEWMEPYIWMNTELHKKSTSDFEKNLYKLMNNSVFGKTMENLRRRVNINLVRSYEDNRRRKLIANPLFARYNIFDDVLVVMQMYRGKLSLTKPAYFGMSVLDLSKHLMYDFYYNKFKPQYGNHCDLL